MLNPLALALHPIMPVRTPRAGRGTILYGYQLRLAEGPALTSEDPVLKAFGASIDAIDETLIDDEAIQSDGFDPGRPLHLVREGVDDDGDEVIGVWDVDELRRAGTLPYGTAARVGAALDHGLPIEAVALSEIRSYADDRREGVGLFVYSPTLVTLDSAADETFRPERRTRPRLVLIADESSGVRWWDPSGTAGPIDLGALPVSAALAEELRDLETLFRNAPEESDAADFDESFEAGWKQHVLSRRTRTVWARVRRELGRRYAIGLLLRGMAEPAWSPEELSDSESDDDIPF